MSVTRLSFILQRYCLLPSCSSHDSALDGIVFIVQSSNMATRTPEMANNFETSSNSFCKDFIAGVIHPKVKLYIKNSPVSCKLKYLQNVNG